MLTNYSTHRIKCHFDRPKGVEKSRSFFRRTISPPVITLYLQLSSRPRPQAAWRDLVPLHRLISPPVIIQRSQFVIPTKAEGRVEGSRPSPSTNLPACHNPTLPICHPDQGRRPREGNDPSSDPVGHSPLAKAR